MGRFVMPSLGADMEEGTILEWLVKPGDAVHKGDVVAVVDTAKAAVDIECFTSGTIGEILVPEGDKVPVGTPLAVIKEPTGAAPSPPKPPTAAKPARARKPPGGKPPVKGPVASPPVRSFAAHHGIDLATVHGTGREGAITRNDVTRALAARPRPAPAGRRITPYARRIAAELDVDLGGLTGDPVRARDVRAAAGAPRQRAKPTEPRRREDREDALRQAIAALMARSKREIPHYYLSTTIDLHTATAWMREHNLRVPVSERVVPAALLLKASALAAKQVPRLNGHWIDDAFHPGNGIHLGVAIALRGGGLVAPALQDADTLGIADLMVRLRELVTRTRSGRLKSSELNTPTITVTNLGDLGVEAVQGVIYPPQVALIGFGTVVDRPWSVDGMLTVRPVVTATLAADHRASDGSTGARLLNTIDGLLQRPEEL